MALRNRSSRFSVADAQVAQCVVALRVQLKPRASPEHGTAENVPERTYVPPRVARSRFPERPFRPVFYLYVVERHGAEELAITLATLALGETGLYQRAK